MPCWRMTSKTILKDILGLRGCIWSLRVGFFFYALLVSTVVPVGLWHVALKKNEMVNARGNSFVQSVLHYIEYFVPVIGIGTWYDLMTLG